MKARTLARHFREGVKNVGRNGWMTIASISSVTVTLLLVGIFLVLMMNLNEVAITIEEDVEIRVHIDRLSEEVDQNQLKIEINQIPEVGSIEFSPKDKELENVIESFGEEGKAFESLREENPLNDVFVVKTKKPTDTPKVAKQIEKMQHVERVNYGEGTVEKLFNVVDIARNIGLILIIGLLFTAMFLIANTIRITIVARKREIEIMKLVGATNSFIRWPFFLEGLFLGIIGALIPILVIYIGYDYLYDTLNPKLQTSFINLLPVNPFIFQLGGILILLGAFIGVWGSLVSVRKFLKV